MSANVMVLAEHTDGQISEGTHELIGQARELAGALGGATEVALLGRADLAGQLGAADIVVCVEHPALEQYVPEAYEQALLEVLAQRSPRLLLLSQRHRRPGPRWRPLGALGRAPGRLRQRPGGRRWRRRGHGADPGREGAGRGRAARRARHRHRAGRRLQLASSRRRRPAGPAPRSSTSARPPASPRCACRCAGWSRPPAGDVDISAADMLVSVGRGIESQDNLETVLELAEALGVPLSASRPVVDAGWLAKSRQVGQSGLKVKPRAYLAFGISGAPEHLEGMRRSELIIACNTDPGAPIFAVAHYGTTLDLFDLVPELVDMVRG